FLEQGLAPQQIKAAYERDLQRFVEERKQYLIYADEDGLLPDKNQEGIKIVVNGRAVSFDSAPYIDEHDRTMVPLRAIAEALGAEVGWDGQTMVVTIQRDGRESLFTIDSNTAVFSGVRVTMDTCPVIRNDRTMLPVRYVAESLGAEVGWNQDTLTVSIESV
ncbi:MAG: copper amine oxidase N-terminal domain-containing protein, partial [Desulfotomaculaceae bacterium]|nr:copper amine oxidase N-terminal domain-containing protein [Desulfotomaculaceae bacterium]